MNDIDLPEEVREFKRFVQNRKGIVEDVRKGKYTWQQLFDIWHLSGEDDPIWERYEQIDESKRESPDYMNKFSNLFDMVSKIDFDQFEKQVNNLSKTIDQVQNFLKKTNGTNPYQQYNQRKRFF